MTDPHEPDEPPYADLARQAFETATTHRLIAHLVHCAALERIAGDDPAMREQAMDAVAFNLEGASKAAEREIESLPNEEVQVMLWEAVERVTRSLALTSNALCTTFRILGGDRENARDMDPEHLALASATALLSGGVEFYKQPPEQDPGATS